MGQRNGRGDNDPRLGDPRSGHHLVERLAARIPRRADVGQVQAVQDVTQGAVLAQGPMQQRDDAGRTVRGQLAEQARAEVADHDLLACFTQRLGHAASRADRDVPFVGQPSGEHDY